MSFSLYFVTFFCIIKSGQGVVWAQDSFLGEFDTKEQELIAFHVSQKWVHNRCNCSVGNFKEDVEFYCTRCDDIIMVDKTEAMKDIITLCKEEIFGLCCQVLLPAQYDWRQ